jgi:NADPH:quinone reductase-like Zn-dependent oxidoreductase
LELRRFSTSTFGRDNYAAPLQEVRPTERTVTQAKTGPQLGIVVRNHAVAINPIDWIKEVAGDAVFNWIKYPFILGCDSAGEVVEVGSAVTRFKVGDR